MPDNPTPVCGQTVRTVFIHTMSQQPLLITLPEGSPRHYVSYRLVVRTIVEAPPVANS